jgi:hypothetical protein
VATLYGIHYTKAELLELQQEVESIPRITQILMQFRSAAIEQGMAPGQDAQRRDECAGGLSQLDAILQLHKEVEHKVREVVESA